MKLVVLAILVATGLVQAEDAPLRRGVLRRSTRQAISSMGGSFLKQTETNIIRNCQRNGLSSSESDDLQKTFNRMVSCMGDTKIYKVPKDEYIEKMETCSRDAIDEVKSCLKQKQKYFPDFILSLSKSLVNLLYDDKDIMASSEVNVCIRNLQNRPVLMEYIKCLTETSAATHDDENIPNSQADFCGKFIPATACFPKTLKSHCSDNSKVNKFFRDYTHAMETPCQTKENVISDEELNRL